MPVSYKEHMWIRGGEIALYILADSKKNIWQYRFKNPLKEGSWIRRSSKTSSEFQACKLAIAEYEEYQTRRLLGITTDETTIKDLVSKFVGSQSSAPRSTKKTTNYLFKVYWSKFFKEQDISVINTDMLEDYFNWRINSHSNIDRGQGWSASESTINRRSLNIDKIHLRKCLRYAVSKGLIARMPDFPYIHLDDTKIHRLPSNMTRGRFTGETGSQYYKTITKDLREIRRCLKKKEWTPVLLDEEKPFHPQENPYYSRAGIIRKKQQYHMGKGDFNEEYCHQNRRYRLASYYFMVMLVSNLGIRPQEMAKLRHKDIKLINDDGTLYTLVNVRAEVSKLKKERQMIARDLHTTYERYLEYRKEIEYRFNRHIEEHDFLFPSCRRDGEYVTHRTSAEYGTIIRERFQELGVHTATIPYGSNNIKVYFTLYSFRSYFITQRLKNKVDLFSLSLQVGSSIATIQKYYQTSIIWDFRESMVQHYRQDLRIDKVDQRLIDLSESYRI